MKWTIRRHRDGHWIAVSPACALKRLHSGILYHFHEFDAPCHVARTREEELAHVYKERS